jgi:hypothetical protein
VNPDGERDYRGHPNPDGNGNWPIALVLIAMVVCVTIICVVGIKN